MLVSFAKFKIESGQFSHRTCDIIRVLSVQSLFTLHHLHYTIYGNSAGFINSIEIGFANLKWRILRNSIK